MELHFLQYMIQFTGVYMLAFWLSGHLHEKKLLKLFNLQKFGFDFFCVFLQEKEIPVLREKDKHCLVSSVLTIFTKKWQCFIFAFIFK